MPLATHEVRWFLDGHSADHPRLRDWFETSRPFKRPATLGRPAWDERDGREPDVYLLIPGGGADIGVKWREGELQVKGRVANLGIQAFGRHHGRVERWMKWSYPGLPDAYEALFRPEMHADLQLVPVTKTRAQRKIRLDTLTGAAEEVDAKASVDRGGALELCDLRVAGRSFCSLALEAYPDDSGMPDAFFDVATAFLEELSAPELTATDSASYPGWLLSLG